MSNSNTSNNEFEKTNFIHEESTKPKTTTNLTEEKKFHEKIIAFLDEDLSSLAEELTG